MGIVLHHVQTAPIPPSARVDQPIPPALDDLILACLAKEPAARPQTARELSLRLAQIGASDGWTEESARLWWEKYRSNP
jgi:serine/threonine-protein kinase